MNLTVISDPWSDSIDIINFRILRVANKHSEQYNKIICHY